MKSLKELPDYVRKPLKQFVIAVGTAASAKLIKDIADKLFNKSS